MVATRFRFRPEFFSDRPLELVSAGELTVCAFKYETGVPALRVENSRSSMVVLPYFGMQVWFVEFDGKAVSQKSMFDMPQDTTKFGDNYGGFLYHCGLNNINGASDGEDPYPIHDVLPFASYRDAWIEAGEDEDGCYVAIGGTYVFRNSQELHWAYTPELRLYEGAAMVEMRATVENRRSHPLEYLWLCHMNWLGVNGSRFVYSCKKDADHIMVSPMDLGDGSPRDEAIKAWSATLLDDPTRADVLGQEGEAYDPELCINYRYDADELGWAHAMMVLPDGDACYVGWELEKAPWALRWFCRTGDEDGVGLALPSTGTNHSTAYQRAHGYCNTLEAGGVDVLRWRFGYLGPDEAQGMANRINAILCK